MAGEEIVGAVGVAIRAAEQGFAADLQAKVKAASTAADKQAVIKPTLDTKGVEAGAAKSQSLVSGIASHADKNPIKPKMDTKEIEAGAAKTQGVLGNLANFTQQKLSSFAGSNNAVTKSLGEIEKAGFASGDALKAGLAGGAVAAAGAIALLVEKGISQFSKLTGEVRKLKAATGESAEEASQLRNVTAGLGVDTDTLVKGLFKLVTNLQAQKNELAGIRVETAQTKDGNVDYGKTLENLRAAYQSIHDPAQKNIFLAEAFRKTGLDLRAVMSANNAEFERLKKTGPIFNDKDLQAGRDLAIAQRELSATVQKLEIDLAKGLIPILSSTVGGLTTVVNAVDGATKHVGGFSNVVHAVSDAANPLGPTLDFLADKHKTLGDAAVALGKTFAGPVTFGLDLIFGGHKKAASAAKDQASADQALIEKTVALNDKLKEEQDQLDKLAGAQSSEIDAEISYSKASYATVKAIDDQTKKEAALKKAINEHGKASDEATIAQDDLGRAMGSVTDSVVAEAKAHADLTVQQKLATGATVNAQEKALIYKGYLLELADTIGGELGDQLRGYANFIKNEVPDKKTTTFYADTSPAMAALQALIIAEERAMIAAGQAQVNLAAYKAAEGGYSSGGYTPAPTETSNANVNNEGRQYGGPVFAGRSYDVGEGGRERLTMLPGGGGYVTPLSDTGRGGLGSVNVSLVINTTGGGAEVLSAGRQVRDDLSGLFETLIRRMDSGSGTR